MFCRTWAKFIFILKWKESYKCNIATIQNYWHRKTWINKLIDYMNLISKMFVLALLLSQRCFWKLSPHRKANKCHSVDILEPSSYMPTKWVWLSKTAQGPEDFGDLDHLGWTVNVDRPTWSESCSDVIWF